MPVLRERASRRAARELVRRGFARTGAASERPLNPAPEGGSREPYGRLAQTDSSDFIHDFIASSNLAPNAPECAPWKTRNWPPIIAFALKLKGLKLSKRACDKN